MGLHGHGHDLLSGRNSTTIWDASPTFKPFYSLITNTRTSMHIQAYTNIMLTGGEDDFFWHVPLRFSAVYENLDFSLLSQRRRRKFWWFPLRFSAAGEKLDDFSFYLSTTAKFLTHFLHLRRRRRIFWHVPKIQRRRRKRMIFPFYLSAAGGIFDIFP